LNPIALGLDHVGIAVGNLDAGRDAFLRLGFTLTARSHHKGARQPGGPLEPWGSANHCAMLAEGYLEVLGVADWDKFSNAKAMVARYEGAHIVALRAGSVASAHAALHGAGLPVDAPRELERMAPYGPDGREQRRVAFRNMYLTKSVFTEAQFQYTEHLTRDAMWQPHLLQHANTARGLEAVFLCSADPAATAAKLAPMLGVAPLAAAPGEQILQLTRSAIRVVSPQRWNLLAPGASLPPLPAPVGVGIRVASLETARAVLERNGVHYGIAPDASVRVDAGLAAGAVLYFTAAA
jgi:catechol 2,3-dioxygenase-like lactoylglutathione lyase family enzyme